MLGLVRAGRPRFAEVAVGLCMLALLLAHGAKGAVQEREVEAAGSGATEQEAISSALANAVGMVNGVSIESRQWMAAFQEAISSSDEGDSFLFHDAAGLDIATLTKGVISSYEVISTKPQSPAVHEARVRATIAVFQRARSADRKRIAVLPLYSRDNYAIDGARINPLAVTDVVEQAIVNELVDSRRFTVLDRRYMEQVDVEMRLLETDDVPVSELVRLGQTLAADYVLVGTLENIGGSTSKRRMKTRDVEFQTLNVNAQLSYQIIDPATKQVKFSRTEAMSFGDRELAATGVPSGSDLATVAVGAAKIIGAEVGATVMEAIYPIMVTAVTSTGVVLGQGGESMTTGLIFDLFRLGERMIDPYTKESIGRVEEWVAAVEITRATNKQSYAKLVKTSDFDLQEHFAPKAFIARRHGSSATGTSVDEQVAETRQSRESRDKAQEALW